MTIETLPGAGAFTNDILVKNFTAIGKEFNNIGQWQRHIEDHIGELYEFVEKAGRMAQAAAKPKGMKTKHKVILGFAAGFYLCRRMTKDDFNKQLVKATQEVRAQYEKLANELKEPKQGDGSGSVG